MSSSLTFNSLSLLSSKHSIPPSKLSRPFPSSFTPSNPISFQRLSTPPPSPPAPLPTPTITSSQTPTQSQILNLPPNLRRIVDLFRSVPDSKLKYRQLLDYASRLPLFPPALKTPDRRVPGCVSQVWLRAYPDPLDPSRVRFDADSDSQLTKGLAALLVLGLSGEPASLVSSLSPDFLPLLGLSQSLTPSRNNGFLNMLLAMQREALKIASAAAEESAGRTRKERIRERLEKALAPVELGVEDVSHLHSGHAAARGTDGDGETHFVVRVVSEKFRGMTAVERHRLVYDLLREEMESRLHALSIDAKAPSEV